MGSCLYNRDRSSSGKFLELSTDITSQTQFREKTKASMCLGEIVFPPYILFFAMHST